MNWVNIGGYNFDVLVTSIEENFTILYDENTGRTMADGAEMTLSPIGTFFGHKITFQRKKGKEADFDLLYDYVSRPRSEGIPVTIVHNQTTRSYQAYISSGNRAVKKIDDENKKVLWDKLTLNIVPMKAQETP